MHKRIGMLFVSGIILLLIACQPAPAAIGPVLPKTASTSSVAPVPLRTPPTEVNDVPRMTPGELAALLEADAEVVVVDTRDRDDYELGHIPGAVVVDDAEAPAFFQTLDADVKIVLYCP